jgi:hypothetical protein
MLYTLDVIETRGCAHGCSSARQLPPPVSWREVRVHLRPLGPPWRLPIRAALGPLAGGVFIAKNGQC